MLRATGTVLSREVLSHSLHVITAAGKAPVAGASYQATVEIAHSGDEVNQCDEAVNHS